jgi:hypothetical protein
MKYKPFKSYSLAIMAGLAARGIASDGLQMLVSIPKPRMARILSGRVEFSDREMAKIEQLTRLTTGQLAASASEPEGGPLTILFNEWATLMPSRLESPPATKAMRTPAKANGTKAQPTGRRTIHSSASNADRGRPRRSRTLAVA